MINTSNQTGTLNLYYESANGVAISRVKQFTIARARDLLKLKLGKEEQEMNFASILGMQYEKGFIKENLQEFKIGDTEIMRVKLYNGKVICLYVDDFTPAQVRGKESYIVEVFPQVMYKKDIQLICVKLENGNFVYIDSNFGAHNTVIKKQAKQ